MSLVLNVEILGEFKKLTSATTGAAQDLKGLKSTTDKISKGMKTALAAIGVGFSLTAVVGALKESTKAAIEDRKSKELLSKALIDNVGATKNQVDAVENYITQAQIASGITDDRLRPAFANLARSSNTLDEAMGYLDIAMDTAAGTGKDLDTVAMAMAKALEGNTTSLGRLVPSVRDAKDPLQALADTFDGAAEAAAKTDPYTTMQIIFGELQEQIGTALLPYLDDFTAWLAEPGTTEMIQEIVTVIVDLIKQFGALVSWAVKYKDILIPLAGAVITFTAAWKAYNIVADITAAKNTAMGASFKGVLGTLTLVVTALQTIEFINKNLMANGGWSRVAGNGAINFSGQSTAPAPTGVQGNMLFGSPTTTKPTVVNNIVVNTPSTNPTAIVSTLQGYQNQTGANIRNLLR